MFTSICIQLQELTKGKTRSQVFFLLFFYVFLPGTFKENSYSCRILINNSKNNRDG